MRVCLCSPHYYNVVKSTMLLLLRTTYSARYQGTQQEHILLCTDTQQVRQPPTCEQGRRALDLILSGGYGTAGGAKKKESTLLRIYIYEHPQIVT